MSSQFFLQQDATLDAIDELSGSAGLVLYCGAGVTIDRTGLSWSRLLEQVLREIGTTADDSERELAAIGYLLKHLGDEEQRASILTEYLTQNQPELASHDLAPILSKILYVKNGWSQGNLLRNVVKLALVAAVRLEGVSIVTTNYDKYIEEAYAEYVRLVTDGADKRELAEVEIPQLVRVALEGVGTPQQEWREKVVSPAVNSQKEIRLVYLHGRAGESGEPVEGTIVLDEFSYAVTRVPVARRLREELDGKSLLIVGASLTDGPLIEALVLSKKADSYQHRFALVYPTLSLSDLGDARYTIAGEDKKQRLEAADVTELLSYRPRQLGVTMLQPGSFAEVAQFVAETDLAVYLRHSQPPRAYRDAAIGVGYAQRSQKWAASWAAAVSAPEQVYAELKSALETRIAPLLPEAAELNHGLRLELWAQANPGASTRTLTLFGNSSGPLLNRDLLRDEELVQDSANASVRTFQLGRPMLHTLKDLGLADVPASRWKAYFSVPIFLPVSTQIGDDIYGGEIPVGVVTLAGLAAARLQQRVKKMTLKQVLALIGELEGTGRVALAAPGL